VNLNHLILRTPLIPSLCTNGDEAQIYLKPENLQIYGSYKIRGIVSVIHHADSQLLKQGISAASAGNMAQAVAYVCKLLDIPCSIFVPDSAPDIKKQMIAKLGARVIELPYHDVWQMVRGDCLPPNQGFFIHPALNEALRAGYATIAHEIIADMPDVDAIVIPFGVGGLSLGVGAAMRSLKRDVAIYTCEPETAAPLHESLKQGRAVTINRVPSFVDAIGTPEVLPRVYELLTPLLIDSLVMPLTEIKLALNSLLINHKLLCEGAAATSFAAAMRLMKTRQYKKIVCILSGGNLSVDILSTIISI
jgi:threonine dehydratase